MLFFQVPCSIPSNRGSVSLLYHICHSTHIYPLIPPWHSYKCLPHLTGCFANTMVLPDHGAAKRAHSPSSSYTGRNRRPSAASCLSACRVGSVLRWRASRVCVPFPQRWYIKQRRAVAASAGKAHVSGPNQHSFVVPLPPQLLPSVSPPPARCRRKRARFVSPLQLAMLKFSIRMGESDANAGDGGDNDADAGDDENNENSRLSFSLRSSFRRHHPAVRGARTALCQARVLPYGATAAAAGHPDPA